MVVADDESCSENSVKAGLAPQAILVLLEYTFAGVQASFFKREGIRVLAKRGNYNQFLEAGSITARIEVIFA